MHDFRILLLAPPVTLSKEDAEHQRIAVVPPLGLAYLGAVLERAEYQVKIVDCLLEGFDTPSTSFDAKIRYGLSDNRIKNIIKKYNPTVVGISCAFSNLHFEAVNLAKIARSQLPSCIIVIGGGHPSIMPERMMEDGAADYLILGEGESTFLCLLDSLRLGNRDYQNIDGIVYHEQGKIIINPKTNYIEDLDSLPFPAWHLLNLRKYNQLQLPHGEYKRKPFVPMFTSRACPAKCIFCGSKNIWGKRYRARSAANVLAEIRYMVKEYGIKEIHFEDDNFTLDHKRAIKIFDGIIDENIDLTWTSPSGLAIFTLDEELIDKMQASGGFSFTLAIESGDQEVLTNIVKKPLKLDQVKAVVDSLRKHGMKTRAFFIIGFPGESKAQIYRTLEYAENLGLSWVALMIATPLPGTEMYDICAKNNYIDVNSINLDELKFGTALINTPEFSAEEIQNIAYEANLRINFTNNYNMRIGNYEEAIIDFERVVHLYPHHLIARLCLGDAYQAVHRHSEALEQWERVLECEPGNKAAEERLDKIKQCHACPK